MILSNLNIDLPARYWGLYLGMAVLLAMVYDIWSDRQ
jgi:hypothetical protein